MIDRIARHLDALQPYVFKAPQFQNMFQWQRRLARSQWAPAERMQQLQLTRLKPLVRFAAEHAPYWRARIAPDVIEDAATVEDALSRLPILSREDLRANPSELACSHLPKGYAAGGERSSSGSTGMMVRITTTDIASHWQNVLGLRSHLWGAREFRRTMGVIRRLKAGTAEYPEGVSARRWGTPRAFPFPTGPGVQLNASASLEQQWEWLGRRRPDYLLTMPSIIRAFAQRSDGEMPFAGFSTIGEVVDDDLRNAARARWGVEIHDMYSSEECGCMAIQCPDAGGYHVTAEAIIVEVLDDRGTPCRPGEIGRVVVTPLFNFATPLLRYDIGDFAQAGASCACGRGLPWVQRIMGRRRNVLVTPDGRRYWPSLQARALQDVIEIRAHQFRQVAVDRMEVWLATPSPATAEQEDRMRKILAKALPSAFEFSFHYLTEFPRSRTVKHEEFVSLVADPGSQPAPPA
jgi:phenylacetate-CoA ligase